MLWLCIQTKLSFPWQPKWKLQEPYLWQGSSQHYSQFRHFRVGVGRKRLQPNKHKEPKAKDAEPRSSDMLCGLVARSLLLFWAQSTHVTLYFRLAVQVANWKQLTDVPTWAPWLLAGSLKDHSKQNHIQVLLCSLMLEGKYPWMLILAFQKSTFDSSVPAHLHIDICLPRIIDIAVVMPDPDYPCWDSIRGGINSRNGCTCMPVYPFSVLVSQRTMLHCFLLGFKSGKYFWAS